MKASVTPIEMLKLVRSPLSLAWMKILDVRMVAAQHAHLGAAAGAGGFDGFAGAVEDAHVGNRAGGARLGALDVGALRPDAGKVIADTAAAAHGFGGLGQRGVDAGLAVGGFDDGVADRLHEAVDQRRLEVGTGGGVDAAGRDETVFLRPQEAASQWARSFSCSTWASA
jgi:hypothetical protein